MSKLTTDGIDDVATDEFECRLALASLMRVSY